ncbi:MAG: hypothetical protein B7Y34_06685 [Methylophilales bacterium 16-45-9]|nr:MAG: hypothetical protein B7Y34_06685 [Methylophilales bacterium 16-45-9]
MYKVLIVLIALSTVACAQLMKGEEQPVVQFRDTKTFKTTCSGTVEDWGSCHRKAKRTCPNGYDVIERKNDSRGIFREMIFSCK